ncbi:uncharacterized protein M437DRAFT_65071 [Aureobasidium melanogenum CBS 110374]|uniref:Uncharacterized protein n=1 Tax=Aureobasidium melanogenum (strain CBS 110374) TaxID=1043003 RepID=A0A074W1F7_AURM1|nr:uncharacterized protein M437DRAFT_65071 [Aureobasidium melanogenum CBS 110374]KEQ63747.1 hypothetical protein M437DRAFT_65071 [Aureobasidium melanogenum CBS 110374]
MSDNESTGESPVKADKKAVVFTEKEEMVLKAAWRCLKSGPPEIDMEKLMKAAGFNTMKTTSNTWGVIKKKLFTDVDGDPLPTAPTQARRQGQEGCCYSHALEEAHQEGC